MQLQPRSFVLPLLLLFLPAPVMWGAPDKSVDTAKRLIVELEETLEGIDRDVEIGKLTPAEAQQLLERALKRFSADIKALGPDIEMDIMRRGQSGGNREGPAVNADYQIVRNAVMISGLMAIGEGALFYQWLSSYELGIGLSLGGSLAIVEILSLPTLAAVIGANALASKFLDAFKARRGRSSLQRAIADHIEQAGLDPRNDRIQFLIESVALRRDDADFLLQGCPFSFRKSS